MDLNEILSQYQKMIGKINEIREDKLKDIEELDKKIQNIQSKADTRTKRWKQDNIDKIQAQIDKKREKLTEWVEQQDSKLQSWLDEKKKDVEEMVKKKLKDQESALNEF